MSKLETLIQQLCPEGVEYKPLSELFDTRNGYTPSKGNLEFWTNGTIPWFRMEDIRENGRILSKATQYVSRSAVKGDLFPENSIIVATSATIGEHALITVPSLANQRFTYLMLKDQYKDCFSAKFLYYYCFELDDYCKACLNQGNFASVDMKKFAKFEFPMVPLEIQREIVRILDNFTELTEKLIAELTARKKQYEYYRDTMLSFKGKIQKVKLREIATSMYRGSGIKRDQITKDGVPCVRYGEIYTTYNTWFDKCVSHTQLEYVPSPKYFEYGDILFAITGESVEDIAKSVAYVGHDKCLAGGDIVVMKHKQNPKYLAYVLSTYEARQQKSKGKIKSKVVHSNVPSIEEIEIPLPPLDVQERLVKVLDNFEAICSDLNIGLPAEIEARQKQYEYYRDALLTYTATGATILTDRQTDRQTDRA